MNNILRLVIQPSRRKKAACLFKNSLNCLFVFALLAVPYRMNGQIYQYTTASSGAYNAIASNMTATGLSRGAGINAGSCGVAEGFGGDGWPTGGFNITNSNTNGDYIEFTITPDANYQFNVTGFTANLRRINFTGPDPNDGPSDVRYAYSTDGGANFTQSSDRSPDSDNLCSGSGNAQSWSGFTSFSTPNSVIFRIYGFNSGSNGTGDLYVRTITVSGTVTIPVQFRSRQDGNWNGANTWQSSTDAGVNWANTASSPTSTAGVITIRNGHTVTVTSSVTVDQVTIESGGQVDVNNGDALTIADGPGTDCLVQGTLENSGTVTATGTLAFDSGGTYEHAQNSGTIPDATWDVNSNCNITGMTDNDPSNLDQTFGNLTFSSNLSNSVTLSTSLTCTGNLTISNVNDGNDLRLTNSSTDRTITVGGDYIHTSGDFVVVSDNGDGTMTVSGDFSIDSGNFILKEEDGAAALNVTGNFNKTGGTINQRTAGSSTSTVTIGGDFNHSSGNYNISTQNDASATLNIAGDFSLTGGTLQETGTGTSAGNIFFNGSGVPQIYTGGGSISATVNFTVNNNAILNLGGFTLSTGGAFTLIGALQMDISGNTPSEYGKISVSGAATLTGGTIEPNFTFTPAVNDNFTLIAAGSRPGSAPTLSIIPNSISGTYTFGTGILTISGVLPIELIFFQGKKRGQTVELTWSTQSEENNDYMAVERSSDGKTFAEIGRIAGARNTYEQQTYALVDEKPLYGMNYYRLRQVDFDGVTTLHKVIGIRFEEKTTGPGLSLSPNPATDRIMAEWLMDSNQPTFIRIFDLNGRQMSAFTAPAGSFNLELPVIDLPAGTYIVQARQGETVEMMKFVKR